MSFYNHLIEIGVAPLPFFHAAGIHYEELTPKGGRIDAVRHFKLLDLIMPHMQDLEGIPSPNFDLFFNHQPSLAAACGNAENLQDALNLFFKYRNLVGDCDSFTQTAQPGKDVNFIFQNERKHDLSTMAATFNFFMVDSVIQYFQGDEYFDKKISLTGKLGNHSKIVSDAFDCPIIQGKHNILSMPSTILTLQNPHSNKRLQPLLIEKLQNSNDRFSNKQKTSNQVIQLIKKQLRQKNDSFKNCDLLNTTCQTLNITRWTLNRRLQAENSSFSLLLKKFRREEACRLLKQNNQSITEISDQLGFINHSSFSRFFSEQFNQSPIKFRKKQT